MSDASPSLRNTPLTTLHEEFGARMVPFAGYAMPVQYPSGILREHQQTREHAGLFDVSHMGQAILTAEPGFDAAVAMESLVPGDLQGLSPGQMRYTLLMNDTGGIRDDLMVSRMAETPDRLFLVVNAACKEADFAHIGHALRGRARLDVLEDRALLALQGPEAAAVMAAFDGKLASMPFMSVGPVTLDGLPCWVSRSGYTGEDGYEISVPASGAEALARRLFEVPSVAPIGLGARDSLRLEAGLCLYGHDIDAETTPVEAGLLWAVAKARREAGGFPGADVVRAQITGGVARKRVGLRPEGRAPVREAAEIVDSGGTVVGRVTSGGFGPTIGGPVAMGYVASALAAPGTTVAVRLRGRDVAAEVVRLPFVAHRYYRG